MTQQCVLFWEKFDKIEQLHMDKFNKSHLLMSTAGKAVPGLPILDNNGKSLISLRTLSAELFLRRKYLVTLTSFDGFLFVDSVG